MLSVALNLHIASCLQHTFESLPVARHLSIEFCVWHAIVLPASLLLYIALCLRHAIVLLPVVCSLPIALFTACLSIASGSHPACNTLFLTCLFVIASCRQPAYYTSITACYSVASGSLLLHTALYLRHTLVLLPVARSLPIIALSLRYVFVLPMALVLHTALCWRQTIVLLPVACSLHFIALLRVFLIVGNGSHPGYCTLFTNCLGVIASFFFPVCALLHLVIDMP